MAFVETYRGTVYRWQVDHVEHFTVAYYFARIQEATASLLEALALGGECRVDGCHVRYLRELRAGDVFHIRSGVAEAAGDALTLVHEIYDTGDGTLCTTVEQAARLAPPAGAPTDAAERGSIAAHRVAWQPPAGGPPPPPLPDGDRGFVETARDRIEPADVGADGLATWAAYVHRFSAANGHSIAAFGMTPAYMRQERRGFSTFEFRLGLSGALRAGDAARVRSALVHVGRSSLRLFHRLANARTGELVATLEQAGVHLDLDARRPVPLPDELHARARALLAAGT